MEIDGQIVLTNTLSGSAYTAPDADYCTLFADGNQLRIKDSSGNVSTIGGGSSDASTLNGLTAAQITGASKIYTDSAVAGITGGSGVASDMLSSLVKSTVSITGASTLTSTATGCWHIMSIGTTGEYVVGLPAASTCTNCLIGLEVSSTSTGTIAITAADIDGETERVMWKNETAVLKSDGSKWTKVAGKTMPMVYHARLAVGSDYSHAAGWLIHRHDEIVTQPIVGSIDATNYTMTLRRKGNFLVHGTCFASSAAGLMLFAYLNTTNVADYDQRLNQEGNLTRDSMYITTFSNLNKNDIMRWYLYISATRTVGDNGNAQYKSFNMHKITEIPSW